MEPRNPAVLWGPLVWSFQQQGPLFHGSPPNIDDVDDLNADLAYSIDEDPYAHSFIFFQNL
jgi:hypothetical protein